MLCKTGHYQHIVWGWEKLILTHTVNLHAKFTLALKRRQLKAHLPARITIAKIWPLAREARSQTHTVSVITALNTAIPLTPHTSDHCHGTVMVQQGPLQATCGTDPLSRDWQEIEGWILKGIPLSHCHSLCLSGILSSLSHTQCYTQWRYKRFLICERRGRASRHIKYQRSNLEKKGNQLLDCCV